MNRIIAVLTAALLSGFLTCPTFSAGTLEPAVTAQGIIRSGTPGTQVRSPLGTYSMVIDQKGVRQHLDKADLMITGARGFELRLHNITGNGFLISDLGYVLAVSAPESPALPVSLQIHNFENRVVYRNTFHRFSNPSLSPDGSQLIFSADELLNVLNLITWKLQSYPGSDVYAAGPDNLMAALIRDEESPHMVVFRGETPIHHILPVEKPRQMGFDVEGSTLFIISRSRLSAICLQTGQIRELYRPESGEIRDLQVNRGRIRLGIRELRNNRYRGRCDVLNFRGNRLGRVWGEEKKISVNSVGESRHDSIPWPYAPNEQHPVGNTYAAYQGFYPSSPYLHPGIDVMGVPGQAVYAVKAGVVKAIITISAELHWRVAIADSGTADPVEGYLYAHLIQNTITVNVGDTVELGQHLGDIIEWPTGFHHIHFARIQDSGSTWHGNWICTENPHLNIDMINDTEPPVILNAYNNERFMFCENETPNYMDSNDLHGEVDIISRMYDRIDSLYDVVVQEIRVSIYPTADPDDPVMDELLSIFFDMELDTYQGGAQSDALVPVFYKRDSTCGSVFDSYSAEYYHIVTNSNGDMVFELSDRDASWDTTAVPDGAYTVAVTGIDVAGNRTTETMDVMVNNYGGATPTPVYDFGVRLELPERVYPGEMFEVIAYLDNPDSIYYSLPVFFILEVDGHFWFWPAWRSWSPPLTPGMDWMVMDIRSGTTPLTVIEEFVWPDTGSSASGLRFHGAVLMPDLSRIMGSSATREWGYGTY